MSQNLQSAQELPKSSLGLGCVHHLAVSWPAQDSKSSCFSSCYVQLSRWLTLLLTVEAVSDCTQNVSKAWGITGRVDFEQIQVEPSKCLRCWDFLSFCLFHPLSFPFNLSPFLSPPIPSSLRKPFAFCPQPCLSLSHHTQKLFGLVRIYFQIYLSSPKTKSWSQCSVEISVFQ